MIKHVNRAAGYAAVFLCGALVMGLSERAYSQYVGAPGYTGKVENAGGNLPAGHKPMRKDLWFYVEQDVPNWKGAPDIAKRHMQHQIDLEASGHLFGGGPVEDPNGKHESGLVIIRAKDAAEARALIEADPMQKEGARTYTLHHWQMNEGTLGLKLNYSTGSFELD